MKLPSVRLASRALEGVAERLALLQALVELLYIGDLCLGGLQLGVGLLCPGHGLPTERLELVQVVGSTAVSSLVRAVRCVSISRVAFACSFSVVGESAGWRSGAAPWPTPPPLRGVSSAGSDGGAGDSTTDASRCAAGVPSAAGD